MPATIADSMSIQLEIVEQMLARYYDQSTSLASELKTNSNVKPASRYLYRIPVMRWVGGTFQKFSANRGDMGSGTGPKFDELKAGFIYTTFNFEVTKEQKDISKAGGAAMADVMAEILSNAHRQLDMHDNISLFGDGTGKLTNSSSASPASTQLTFAGATDTLGVNRLFLGMAVDVWDSTGATKRSGGPYYISNIDWSSKVVTFSAAVTGITSGDLLAFVGMDAYGPSALTSFSAGWPATSALTNAAGLTNDSYRHGLAYANNATAANYYLGKQKSSFGELLPSTTAAAGSALTFSAVELSKNQMLQRRDESILDGLKCVVHMAQRQQLQDILTATSVWHRGSSDSMIDLQAKAQKTFMVADIPFIVDKRQAKDRVDAFNPKNWGRVEGYSPEWFDYGDGQKMKAVTSSSTGNPLAAWEMKLTQMMDFFCMDPGASFYIDGLAVPTGL